MWVCWVCVCASECERELCGALRRRLTHTCASPTHTHTKVASTKSENSTSAHHHQIKMSQYIGPSRLAFARTWHHVDMAQDPRTLGRLASAIAITLMGKHKPVYDPSDDCGDYVVVTNCQYLNVTGKKYETKLYRKHSGRPGNLKEWTMRDLANRKGGGEILKKAVSGMLPKNSLRKVMLDRLKLVEDSKNPYADNIFATYQEAQLRAEQKK